MSTPTRHTTAMPFYLAIKRAALVAPVETKKAWEGMHADISARKNAALEWHCMSVQDVRDMRSAAQYMARDAVDLAYAEMIMHIPDIESHVTFHHSHGRVKLANYADRLNEFADDLAKSKKTWALFGGGPMPETEKPKRKKSEWCNRALSAFKCAMESKNKDYGVASPIAFDQLGSIAYEHRKGKPFLMVAPSKIDGLPERIRTALNEHGRWVAFDILSGQSVNSGKGGRSRAACEKMAMEWWALDGVPEKVAAALASLTAHDTAAAKREWLDLHGVTADCVQTEPAHDDGMAAMLTEMVADAVACGALPEVSPVPEVVPVTELKPVAQVATKDDIYPRRVSDWIHGQNGWRVVGGGRNVPGYKSERAAKIDIGKNPEWKAKGATIIEFRYNDGGMLGCSPYAKTETRYAIFVRKPDAVAEEKPAIVDACVPEVTEAPKLYHVVTVNELTCTEVTVTENPTSYDNAQSIKCRFAYHADIRVDIREAPPLAHDAPDNAPGVPDNAADGANPHGIGHATSATTPSEYTPPDSGTDTANSAQYTGPDGPIKRHNNKTGPGFIAYRSTTSPPHRTRHAHRWPDMLRTWPDFAPLMHMGPDGQPYASKAHAKRLHRTAWGNHAPPDSGPHCRPKPAPNQGPKSARHGGPCAPMHATTPKKCGLMCAIFRTRYRQKNRRKSAAIRKAWPVFWPEFSHSLIFRLLIFCTLHMACIVTLKTTPNTITRMPHGMPGLRH